MIQLDSKTEPDQNGTKGSESLGGFESLVNYEINPAVVVFLL